MRYPHEISCSIFKRLFHSIPVETCIALNSHINFAVFPHWSVKRSMYVICVFVCMFSKALLHMWKKPLHPAGLLTLHCFVKRTTYICSMSRCDCMCTFKLYHKEGLPLFKYSYLYYMEVMPGFFKGTWEKWRTRSKTECYAGLKNHQPYLRGGGTQDSPK